MLQARTQPGAQRHATITNTHTHTHIPIWRGFFSLPRSAHSYAGTALCRLQFSGSSTGVDDRWWFGAKLMTHSKSAAICSCHRIIFLKVAVPAEISRRVFMNFSDFVEFLWLLCFGRGFFFLSVLMWWTIMFHFEKWADSLCHFCVWLYVCIDPLCANWRGFRQK